MPQTPESLAQPCLKRTYSEPHKVGTMIHAGIPYTLLEGHEDHDVPTVFLSL